MFILLCPIKLFASLVNCFVSLDDFSCLTFSLRALDVTSPIIDLIVSIYALTSFIYSSTTFLSVFDKNSGLT